MLRATWSPVNRAYVVTFGSALCGIGPENRCLWGSKAALDGCLFGLGLVRRRDGRIVARAEAEMVRIGVVAEETKDGGA